MRVFTWLTALVVLLGGAVLAVVGLSNDDGAGASSQPVSAETRAQPAFSQAVQEAPPPSPSVPVTFPVSGGRTYSTVAGTGAVIGTAGKLMRFHVSIEKDIRNLDAGAFVAFVEQTYGDPRGWTSHGDWRFQRVGPGQAADFTLYLVTPATRDRLCASDFDRYTSCRNGESVVLNVMRWTRSVPDYGASLDTYRQYMVNHETGHRLGNGHELCPASGAPAPVMEQQTLGLHGCTANPWPYVDGRRYQGHSGAYDDPLPKDN
jgi:hypothetical protein